MKFVQITMVILSLLGLLVDWAAADIAPPPIRDTGIWNDPARFRLVDNIVDITLGNEVAEISACFLFVSTHKLHYGDTGELEWAWPLPSGYPLPRPFNVVTVSKPCLCDAKEIEHFQKTPCTVPHEERYIRSVKLESFDQLGIRDWYVFRDEFLMYMPGPFLIVETIVRYTQPYKWKENGLGELIYVFRTGGLWSESIERLKLQVQSTPGMELTNCSWSLKDGKTELTDTEPESDLLLTVRRVLADVPEGQD